MPVRVRTATSIQSSPSATWGPILPPHSFYFKMHRLLPDGTYKFWFDGGLIYHGPGQPGDGSAPAFSVEVGGPEGPHWSIHT